MKRLLLLNLILALLCALSSCSTSEPREYIDLSGSWAFALDGADVGVEQNWQSKEFTEQVTLPGTTDTNKKGEKNDYMGETRFLSRKYLFEGKAWYQRQIDIPSNWDNSRVELFIERSKPTTVWVNDKEVGSQFSLTTPHIYNITPYIEAGESYRLTVVCDNKQERLPIMVFNSHCNNNDTQTNWNGLVGKIELRKKSVDYIERVKLTPHLDKDGVEVVVDLNSDPAKKGYYLEIMCSRDNSSMSSLNIDNVGKTNSTLYPMGENYTCWSEFTPQLYNCNVTLFDKNGKAIDRVSETFGMREFKADNLKLYNNGKRVFLRGKHDGAAFPTDAYAPMDTAQWGRYLRICQDYGINHVRFHSWCPPKAAMEMADKLGVYFEIELPFWGTMRRNDKELSDYLYVEAKRILDNYANHPSVVLLALGNELKGDTTQLGNLVKFIKEERPSLLSATGANNFLGCYGSHSQDDFAVTCRVGGSPSDTLYDKNVRASFSFVDSKEGGYINNSYPNSKMIFAPAFANAVVPVIGHETGQYQCFPNFDEIAKYNGVLEPRNMVIFKKRLEDAGMIELAEKFKKASGAWQTLLYRADVEMNLRSDEMSGFQLLDLQDYPGQGTALVGILDAFMDSKGFIEPQDWRKFCSSLVPLAILEKFVYEGEEVMCGEVKIFNYSQNDLTNQTLSIKLEDKNGKSLFNNELKVNAPTGALTEVSQFEIKLPKVEKAQKLNLSIDCRGENGANNYSIWLYPAKEEVVKNDKFIVARKINNKLYSDLENGNTVLLIPEENELKDMTLEPLFMTDYWNFRMFKLISEAKKSKVSPGTLGLLIDEKHPALASFPTSFHTDMQWYSILKNARPLILENLPTFKQPIVQVIDNFERNYKLALITECRVGKGKLLICMSDLLSISQYPEARSLYNSLSNYISSDEFTPTENYTINDLKKLFTTKVEDVELEELINVSYKYKEGKND